MNKKIKIFSTMAAASVTAIHIFNRIQYTIANKNNILNLTENNEYEWRFGKIHYIKKGKGTPILLLHDLTAGSSHYEFHKIMDPLSRQYEVYAIDLLGYGLSDKPNMTYTSFLYVQLLTDFVKTVIGRKTDVIATGDSSSLVVMTCHNNPEVFNRLVLINPQSLYQFNLIPSRKTRTLKLLIDLPIIGTFLYNLVTSRTAFLHLFHNHYFTDCSELEKSDLLAYVESSHKNDYTSKYSFSSYIGRYLNFNILHALKEINHSIFIIAGSSKQDNRLIVKNYLNYNSSIEVAFISNTRQYPHLELPQMFLNQLEIFL